MNIMLSVIAQNEQEALEIAKTIPGFHIPVGSSVELLSNLRSEIEYLVPGTADEPLVHDKVLRCIKNEPRPVQVKRKRSQKLILRFELSFEEGIISKDAEARDLLKMLVAQINEQLKPGEIHAKIIEDGAPRQGKEVLATADCSEGLVVAMTTTERWKEDHPRMDLPDSI